MKEKKSNFISITLDEGRHTNNNTQLAIAVKFCLRGISYKNFIDFVDLKYNKTADDIIKAISHLFDDFNFDEKLVCQSYDGAAVIAGKYNGVAAKIKEKYKNAGFLYCKHMVSILLLKNLFNQTHKEIFF